MTILTIKFKRGEGALPCFLNLLSKEGFYVTVCQNCILHNPKSHRIPTTMNLPPEFHGKLIRKVCQEDQERICGILSSDYAV